MSDSNAEKPKERHRTCGTCKHAFNQDIPCCVPVIGCDDIRAFYREVGCNHYTERTDTIEQRYEKLEQVAKDMYLFIALEDGLKDVTIRAQGKPRDKIYNRERFSEQLEALWVSLYD